MSHIAEFTKYSDKQHKAKSGNECQDFRGAAMVMGTNNAMIQGVDMHDASGRTIDKQPEYEKLREVHPNMDKRS